MRTRTATAVFQLLRVVVFLAGPFIFSGCGGGSGGTPVVQPPPPNAPTILSVSPSNILMGGPGFTLTVNGANFVSNATVLWNGSARQTTFMSSTQLQAAITAADVGASGSINISVSMPGSSGAVVTSNNVAFTVTQPPPPIVPTITSLNPGFVTAGGPAFTLTVNGTNFEFLSSVLWNGSVRPTTKISNTQLQAAISAADIAGPGAITVAVSTPAPGGTTVRSNNFGLTVIPPLPGVPAISSLSPPGAVAGGLAFTLTVNGTNFFSNSNVLWNGNPRPTTFISSTRLHADIAAGDIAGPSDVNISVSNPITGGTINSTSFPFAVTTSFAPQLTGLSPLSTVFGSKDFVMSVFGANFVPGATVLFNGNPRTTTFVATTRLDAVITTADIPAPGTAQVSVSDPPPEGLSSNSLDFTIGPNPFPRISFTVPGSVVVGGPAFKLIVASPFCLPIGLETGCLVPSSVVLWNGSPRPTTFLDPGGVEADISAADIAVPGQISVQVFSPGPGGGTSNPALFTIKPHLPPGIFGLVPAAATAGGPGFTLAVNGANFESGSVVKWNGVARPTTFVSSGELHIDVTAADIATPGSAAVSVTTPLGGTSLEIPFIITFPTTLIDQSSRDIAYDPLQKVLYLSVPAGATTHPNTITVADPVNSTITNSVAAGSDPHVLAISGDSAFLYAGIDGASKVQRFTLPALAADISYPLTPSPTAGPSFALDLQVAPGAPHTTAVTLGNTGAGTAANLGIFIYDDSTPRPTIAKGFASGGGLYDSLAWGSDATVLFAANNESNTFDFYTLAVDANGITLNKDFPNVFFRFVNKIHFDPVTKVVFSNDGPVADATGLLGTISASGPMTADGALNAAFFIVPSPVGPNVYDIRKYELKTFSLVDTITVSNIVGTPARLIRWDAHGLAFNTIVPGNPTAGKVYAISSTTFVK